MNNKTPKQVLHTGRWPYTFKASADTSKNEGAYDGDTVYLVVDRGEGHFNKAKYRLEGVDTPEIRKPASEDEQIWGLDARSFVRSLLEDNKELVVTTHKSKYGYAAEIWVRYLEGSTEPCFKQVSLSKHIIQRGHGVAYDGGKKESWKVRRAEMLAAKLEWRHSESDE